MWLFRKKTSVKEVSHCEDELAHGKVATVREVVTGNTAEPVVGMPSPARSEATQQRPPAVEPPRSPELQVVQQRPVATEPPRSPELQAISEPSPVAPDIEEDAYRIGVANSPVAAKPDSKWRADVPAMSNPGTPQAAGHKERVTPRAPNAADEDSVLLEVPVDFDEPMEQVYRNCSEVFGKMIVSQLQSSKWDKRAHALKEVGNVLKGMDQWQQPGSTRIVGKGRTRLNRAKCWRLSCQLLNHAMCDKVMPVKLAAMDLFIDTFTLVDTFTSEDNIPRSQVNQALDRLLEYINVTLGDSNCRLHEGARKCVLFCAERGVPGLTGVLKALRDRLTSAEATRDKTKVHFGVLDTVIILLQHFPGQRSTGRKQGAHECDMDDQDEAEYQEDSWTQEDIAPFVIAGLDDSLGSRVRGRAVALAVTAYQTLGEEAMRPMLESLRPAKQALLKQKFFESEEEGHVEEEGQLGGTGLVKTGPLNDLMVCGLGVKASTDDHPKLLPGVCNAELEEEYLMDGILEEVGAVFAGTGFPNNLAAPVGGEAPRHIGLGAHEFSSELYAMEALEEELMALGVGIDALTEQDALLNSIKDEQDALLNSIKESTREVHPYVEGDLCIEAC